MGIDRTVGVAPCGVEIRSHFRCGHQNEVIVRNGCALCSQLIAVADGSLGADLVITGVIVDGVLDRADHLVVGDLQAAYAQVAGEILLAVVGDEVGEVCAVVCAAIAADIGLAVRADTVVIGGAVGQTVQFRVVVVGEAAVQILERQAVLDHMGRADTGTAQLKAVAVTFAVALAELGIAVAECHAVLDGNNADRTGLRLCEQIPAVVAVVVGHTAVKYIALAAGQLCCEAVRIFHGGVVAVVLGGAVQNQVVAGPVCNGSCTGFIPGQL